MGFEDARDEFWRGRDDGPHSKLNFLRTLILCGGAFTGREDGVEVPYYGAIEHAEQLEAEGLAARAPEQPIEGAVIWVPTERGKRSC